MTLGLPTAGDTIAARLAGMEPVIELLGAVLILSAFVLVQLNRLRTTSLTYLLLNLTGSGTLAVVAAVDRDVGFLFLEGVWAAVSAASTVRLLLGRATQ